MTKDRNDAIMLWDYSRSPDFADLLGEMWNLHLKKSGDYDGSQVRFHNIRASEDFGIPAWKGALLRANDKVKRIQTFCQEGTLSNESFEDALIDLANYAVIALCLYRETTGSTHSIDSMATPVVD